MADKTFRIEVITPDRTALEGEMTSIQLRAVDGRFGVLPNHAPLIAMLDVGRMFSTDAAGKDSALALGEGFIEVLKNRVKVLVDSAELSEEIDLKRAEEAKKRAEERLQNRASEDIDVERAELALKRALVRLKLGGRR